MSTYTSELTQIVQLINIAGNNLESGDDFVCLVESKNTSVILSNFDANSSLFLSQRCLRIQGYKNTRMASSETIT
jgi:hypothetical protein